MKNKNNLKRQSGQVLLIIVLLLATTLTIVMTAVFTSRTETKVAKLQQDADRSLAAAEAGIEAAIKSDVSDTPYTFEQLQIANLNGIDPNNSNVKVVEKKETNFTSPLIDRNNQYTVYLAPYKEDGTFGPSMTPTTLNVFYCSDESTDCNTLAVELSVISYNPNAPAGESKYSVQRSIADTGGILGGTQTGNCSLSGQFRMGPVGADSSNYRCSIPIVLPSAPWNSQLMIVRTFSTTSSNSTRIGIDNSNLPSQGKYYISEAKSTSGVTKRVQLFQAYPQVPENLFVTSF